MNTRIRTYLSIALVPATFLASGAFLVWKLPIQPFAQALFVFVPAIWLILSALGILPVVKPSRPAMIISALCVLAAIVPWLAGQFSFQAFFYDVYGEMPLLLWLMFPLTFLLASTVVFDCTIKRGIEIVTTIGGALIAFAVVWRFTQGFVTVFGSPAYAVPALIVIPVLMLGLAASLKVLAKWWRLAAILSAAGIIYASGGLLGMMAVSGATALLLAFAPNLLGIPNSRQHIVRVVGYVLCVVMACALLAASIPAISGTILSKDYAATAEQTVATRIYLWHGAQDMFAEKPWLGWGTNGYRFNALKFYDTRIFGFIANIGTDPIVYSAPSPHSLLWEILTRLGLWGLICLGAAAAIWIQTLRKTKSSNAIQLACTIATGSYLIALAVTPMHYASALLGVACAGFALAPLGSQVFCSNTKKADAPKTKGNQKLDQSFVAKVKTIPCVSDGIYSQRVSILVKVMSGVLGSVLIATAVWLGYSLDVAQIRGVSYEEDFARLEKAQKLLPNNPNVTRYLLDAKLMEATIEEEINAVIAEITSAPAYVNEYGPNLVRFAEIALSNAEDVPGMNLLSIGEMFEPTFMLMSPTPAFYGELLHLAVLDADGSEETIQESVKRFEPLVHLYPQGQRYLDMADDKAK